MSTRAGFFAMGHGDGAMIANQLACLRGNVLRGVAPFAGAGPDQSLGSTCTGKVAAFIGHDPERGRRRPVRESHRGSCPWTLLWATRDGRPHNTGPRRTAAPTRRSMPTAPFAGDGATGSAAARASHCRDAAEATP